MLIPGIIPVLTLLETGHQIVSAQIVLHSDLEDYVQIDQLQRHIETRTGEWCLLLLTIFVS